jgi:cell wall-associated NlpC family hydrolase
MTHHTADPRVTLALPHLADLSLEGHVAATRYVQPQSLRLLDGAALLYTTPGGEVVSELVHGEAIRILETSPDGWSFGQCVADGYVGYVQARFGAPDPAPTHIVNSAGSHLYEGPSVRAPIHLALTPGARLTMSDARPEKGWAQTADGRFVPASHLLPIDASGGDPASIAEALLHAPYRWGGRSRNGYDCSGLVQVALQVCGYDCPRDTDMQEKALGQEVNPAEGLRRGDLVFWTGHVGMMINTATLLHANGYHMAVAAEPLHEAIARIASGFGGVTSHRRGPWVK